MVFKFVLATYRKITVPEPPRAALISSGSVPPPPPPKLSAPGVGFVYWPAVDAPVLPNELPLPPPPKPPCPPPFV